MRTFLDRKTIASLGSFVLLATSACHKSTPAEEVNAGDTLFHERCAVCHGTGTTSGQGPGLAGIVGRKAATMPFAYSAALRAAGLTFDKGTLDHFLAGPTQAVPGTTMAIAVSGEGDRRALIAYLSTLQAPAFAATSSADAAPASTTAAPPAPPAYHTGAAAFGDYHADGPGVRRLVKVADLPAPYQSPSAQNGPSVSPRPDSVLPVAAPGYVVTLFADALTNPRAVRVAPNGDIFVAESAENRIHVLRAADGAAKSSASEVFATGLTQPFGMAFYPPGPNPLWLYVANTNGVVRFAYTPGDLHAKSAPEVIVSKLIDWSGGHWTRDVAFSFDGKQMFVSVGSGSNVAEKMAKTPPSPTWIAEHALGATWGEEEHRADVLVFTPDGKNESVYATGIRNCVGLAIHPTSGDVWCSTNERDGLGDDLVPDYVTRVKQAAYYGWPWRYLGDHVDPRHDGERLDLAGKATIPDVLLQSHSASLEMMFYDGAMFPELRGYAFSALHGSWNRGVRTSPKVIRMPVDGAGVPSGEYEDFLTGFVLDDAHMWGRPVGIAVAHDGAILVTEDANGTMWRVAHK